MRKETVIKKGFFFLLTVVAAVAVVAAGATDETAGRTAFAAIVDDYEAVRQALLNDKTDGIAEHAEAIRRAAAALAEDFSVERAGVSAEDADGVKALLPDVVEAAGRLAGAGDIAAAREAFFLLSKRLARYREMVSGERPAVAYCPMVKKSWLQPLVEIGNPYHGQSMPRCGEIVSE